MIIHVIADVMPPNCGDCQLMQYIGDEPKCCALPDDINEISGNPYSMKYRRSDCPITVLSEHEFRRAYERTD